MKTRNGKIARLPKKIRDELNRRIEDASTGPQLIEWLNSLPVVQRVLRDQFHGHSITEQNLSHWRAGGFADWQRHNETQEQLRWMIERSNEINVDERDEYICESLARVVTAELAQHTQRLGEIKDPKERWRQFREVSLELWRLRNGTHYSRSVGLNCDRWQRTVDQEDAIVEQQRQEAEQQRKDTQEANLERLMNLMHTPDVREWVRTDWPSKEAEMARLREIYYLPPNSKDTPTHPSQRSLDAVRRSAVYNYPSNPTESK